MQTTAPTRAEIREALMVLARYGRLGVADPPSSKPAAVGARAR